MKSLKAVKLLVVCFVFVSAGFLSCDRSQQPRTLQSERAAGPSPTAIPVTVTPVPPSELNEGGGAPAATMQQAAAFAWQEFIALNWPAVAQTGGVVNNAFVKQRDMPDTSAKFGDPNYKGPLVWQTFRGKVEIFPGNTAPTPTPVPPATPAPGPTATPPPGYPSVVSGDDSFGYDALPVYNYASAVPACVASPAPTGTAWINLDETDQIGLDSMFAGVVPTPTPPPTNLPPPVPGSFNSSPQLIRFMAKASRNEYTYVASQGYYNAATDTGGWWYRLPNTVKNNTIQHLRTTKTSPTPGSSDLVSLPNGTFETKAGWRVLTPAEMSSGRFHTATVRYYENGANNSPCYRQDTFGLVALHIIQKTPTAPYFIYATFEQADNILTSGGARVEDEQGNINQPAPCPPGQTAPCPTTPAVTLEDTPVVNADTQLPPQVNTVPGNAGYCTPGSQAYYINSSNFSTANGGGLPGAGPICINYRDNAIPQPVIDSNKAAHDAIKAYNTAQGITDSVWLYYKLINVQYVPIDKDYAGLYKTNDPNTGQNPSSFHLANIMVETNRTLQLFSGSLIAATGVNSDYSSQFPQPTPTPPSGSPDIRRQVYYAGKQYNMGGCMACHAAQGQDIGGDFSVILQRGNVGSPEAPAQQTTTGMALVKRNRSLVP